MLKNEIKKNMSLKKSNKKKRNGFWSHAKYLRAKYFCLTLKTIFKKWRR